MWMPHDEHLSSRTKEVTMDNYEFWDELGKIFNAVVAYQEKSVEFNKRFINPWIRLGNVFDKQDRNKEAAQMLQQAISIDPANSQNWYDLGNIYFRMGTYEEAVAAYTRAIELAPESGWAYNNLGLTFANQCKYADAIPLYQTSISLLEEEKDQAVAWNRLGNAYRKTNDYELAVQAFQKADELDRENGGFRDELDDAPEAPTSTNATIPEDRGPDPDTSEELNSSPAQPGDMEAGVLSPEVPADQGVVVAPEIEDQGGDAATAADSPADQPFIEPPLPGHPPDQILANTQAVADSQETDQASPSAQMDFDSALASEGISDSASIEPPSSSEPENTSQAAIGSGVEDGNTAETAQADPETESEPLVVGLASWAVTTEANEPASAPVEPSEEAAYEEFLEDSNETLDLLMAEAAPAVAEDPQPDPAQEPVAKITAAGDVQIEVDTNNAHVWNELGNVYFNTRSFEDAIVAYSKAIELDRWFAWPYRKLALAYAQKSRI